MGKIISIAVRDFALPVPRSGSIEAHSGYGREDGQEIHARVQGQRATANKNYRSEVKLVQDFECGTLCFRVGGRVDGLFSGPSAKIEEIKSSFNLKDLKRRLTDGIYDHPYCLQLRTYGYLYWRQNQIEPQLSFHLVSSRSFSSEDLTIELDLPRYEDWLGRRLAELATQVRKNEKRIRRRKKIALHFAFPFDTPRSGQKELIQTVEEGMREPRRMLIQAPTGLGKTAGVLYPTLKQALSRGQKVVYVTPKNSQHSVAEDAVARFREKGAKVKALTLTAKSKICFKNEPLCNPDYCEFAKDHYRKVHEHDLPDRLAKKRKLSSRTFRQLGERYQVCPFELQLEATDPADVVICDYNYVFAPRTLFGRLNAPPLGTEGKPNLVVDEAHNLPARAMDYYSPALSGAVLEKMRPALQNLPLKFRKDAEYLLDECRQTIAACRPEGLKSSAKIAPPADLFLEQEAKLRSFLSRYLDSETEILPRDPVLRLCFYWSEFTAALDYVSDPARAEFFTSFQISRTGEGTVKITCCDASQMLEGVYDDYAQVVGFSATLKPFDYYAKLSGLAPASLKTAEFCSPFSPRNRKLLIIPQISTKYSARERNYAKIAEAIQRISSVKSGNYFAFFPSFDFMGRVLEIFHPPARFRVIAQERDMSANRLKEVLGQLRQPATPTLVFAVQGGVFSEGVDYPGDTVIGAFVVGPPLPSFDLEREQMRAYYERNYGSGFEYAYTFPAMAKAVQAAGRVIRSETDRGLIVLFDDRFIQPSYSQSMPSDWFTTTPRELISKGILKEVSDFWGTDPNPDPSSS